jgi:hypothetical protein
LIYDSQIIHKKMEVIMIGLQNKIKKLIIKTSSVIKTRIIIVT